MRHQVAVALASVILLGAAGALAALARGRLPATPASVTAALLPRRRRRQLRRRPPRPEPRGRNRGNRPQQPRARSGSYLVTVAPLGKQVFGTSSPITVGGLQPNTSYRFRVTASSAAGSGLSSAPSAPVTTLRAAGWSDAAGPQRPEGLADLVLRRDQRRSLTPGKAPARRSLTLDSAAATLTIDVIRVNNGYMRAGACLTHASPTGKRCTSYHLLGTVTKTDTAGANSLHFSGRLGGRALTGGVYQLRLTATADGLTGNTRQGVPIDLSKRSLILRCARGARPGTPPTRAPRRAARRPSSP